MLAMRLAYIHQESDGYTDLAEFETVPTTEDAFNYIYSGNNVKADDLDGDSGRVTVLFEPTDTLSFTTRYNHTDYETGLISEVADGPMIFEEDSAVIRPDGEVYVADRDDNLMFQDNKDYSDYTLDEYNLRAEWSGDVGRIVSLTQYQEFDTELSETVEGKPSPFIQPRILTSNMTRCSARNCAGIARSAIPSNTSSVRSTQIMTSVSVTSGLNRLPNNR